MATIKSQMTLNDGMSAVLKKITRALDITLASFEQVQQASGKAIDTHLIEEGRGLIVEVNRDFERMAEECQKAAQEEEKLNQGIRQGTFAMDGLLGKAKSLAVSLGTAAGIRQLWSLSDQMTSTVARLDLIVDDGGSVNELEAKIMASAQRSRAAYLDTASAIANMGANAGSAFNGNDELISFMEQVNKQFVIGGASTQGQSAAMLQLTQAMAAGVLRGEELNSILENAPGIARAIEQYMGIAEGSIKSYAEQGLVTSVIVKNALFAAADETNAKFEGMPKTWGQVWIGMQNQALTAIDPILEKINLLANSPQLQSGINGLLNGLKMVAVVGGAALDILINGSSFVADNWGWIGPIMWGVVAVLIAYGGYLAITSALEAASNIQKGIAAVAAYAHAEATKAEARAEAAATAAQYGLNAALLTCPITWVVVGVIALVAAINHFAGTSVSATGLICGAVAVAGAFIGNTVIGLLNALITMVWTIFAAPFLGIIEFVLNAANGGFNSFGDGVANLIGQIIGWFLNLGKVVTTIIDAIFGTDFTAGLESLQNTVTAWGKNDSAITLDKSAPTIDYRFEYGSAWDSGYSFGQGIEDKVGSLFSYTPEDYTGTGLDNFMLDGLGNDVGAIADNTSGMAGALEVSGEELKYLRDIAERDAINRFTTAEVKIDMTGMTNKIDGSMDLDGVIRELTDGFSEALVTAAEGVHE